MTEDSLSQLLKEYASPLAPGPAAVVPQPQRRVAYGWMGAIAVAGAFAVFALIPREAGASSLRRVQSAITNAHSMVATITVTDERPETGTPYLRISYLNGMWRYDPLNELMPDRHYIDRNGFHYEFMPRLALVTKDQLKTESTKEMSGVDFAKSLWALDLKDDRITKHQGLRADNGRSAYSLVFDRASDHTHAEILVDESTDLPIRSEMTQTTTNVRYGVMHARVVVDYSFGLKLPDSTFDPASFGPPIHDLMREREALGINWSKPVATIGDYQVVRDWIDSDGHLFVAISAPAREYVPLVQGDGGSPEVTFVKIRAGAWLSEPFRWQGDRQVQLFAFAALHPTVGLAKPLHFELLPDEEHHPLPSDRKPIPIEVPAPQIEETIPTLIAFGARERFLQVEAGLDSARADWYKDRHRFAEELPWRWSAYRKMQAYLPRGARVIFAPPIADCLTRLGKPEEAKQVLKEYGEHLRPVPASSPVP